VADNVEGVVIRWRGIKNLGKMLFKIVRQSSLSYLNMTIVPIFGHYFLLLIVWLVKQTNLALFCQSAGYNYQLYTKQALFPMQNKAEAAFCPRQKD
jgi:hypothetical protein